MSDIKIRYIMKHKPSGNVHVVYYSLSQIEQRPLKDLSIVFSDEHEMLSRDIYTGLKDKNFRDIYEGDILQVNPENKEHYPEKSVFWVTSHNSLWGYEFSWEHVSGYDCSTHIVESNSKGTKLLNTEIIGNIYENPELLEGDN